MTGTLSIQINTLGENVKNYLAKKLENVEMDDFIYSHKKSVKWKSPNHFFCLFPPPYKYVISSIDRQNVIDILCKAKRKEQIFLERALQSREGL